MLWISGGENSAAETWDIFVAAFVTGPHHHSILKSGVRGPYLLFNSLLIQSSRRCACKSLRSGRRTCRICRAAIARKRRMCERKRDVGVVDIAVDDIGQLDVAEFFFTCQVRRGPVGQNLLIRAERYGRRRVKRSPSRKLCLKSAGYCCSSVVPYLMNVAERESGCDVAVNARTNPIPAEPPYTLPFVGAWEVNLRSGLLEVTGLGTPPWHIPRSAEGKYPGIWPKGNLSRWYTLSSVARLYCCPIS